MPAFSSVVVLIFTLFFLNLPAFAQSPKSKPLDVQRRLNQELSDATRSGDIQKMKRLIEDGADVNCCTNYGTGTPLMSAAFSRNIEAVTLLLDAGAAVNLQNGQGETALFKVAGFCGELDKTLKIAELLLQKGADPNIKDKKGQTLFEKHSISLIHGCEKLHKLLLGYKKQDSSTPDSSSSYKKNLEARLVAAAGDGNIGEMKTLIAGGADVNCCKKQGHGTPLMAAAFHQQTEAVMFLLEHGADVNLQDNQGWTALFKAVPSCAVRQSESLKIAEMLLENGADITILDRYGSSAWYGAYPQMPPFGFSNCRPMRELLFKYTQKQAVKLNVGWTEGRKTPWQSCLHDFLSRFAEGNGTPLMRAAFHGNAEAVTFLLNSGADVNLQDRDGRTALHKAMPTCGDKVADILLQRGADPNIKPEFSTGVIRECLSL